MPYTPTVWTDEIPSSTPVKYAITDDTNGAIAASATIEIVTPVTSGTAVNAANLNKLEAAIQAAVALAEQAVANTLTPADVVDAIWKVGDLYISTSPIDPATKYGVGTWEYYGAGKTLVGIDEADEDFDTVGKTGGAKEVSLTGTQNGPHAHTYSRYSQTQNVESGQQGAAYNVAVTANTSSSGNGEAHENMPPFVVVYFWRRTA